MRIKLQLVVVVVMSAVLVLSVAGPAAAYPRASYLRLAGASFWACSGRVADLSFEAERYINVRREDRAGGRYTYNRDTGKVNFRSGHLDHLFGKLRRGPNEYQRWILELRRKDNRRLLGSCQPTSYGY